MNQLTQLFTSYIDTTLAVLIIVSAYWLRKYLVNLFPNILMAHKVLLWSTIISIGYYFLLKYTGSLRKDGIIVYVITYFFTTSFYELIFSPLEKWISSVVLKFFPSDQTTQPL